MANRSQPSDIDRICEAIHGLQKSLECTICLEFLTEPTKTRCGHSFCRTCVGKVLQMKDACCPLCKKSLNRRNISKDDDLQTYIEKFKNLVTAIQNDTNIEYTELLSHWKKPCNTKESCSYSDSRQPSQDSNKEKRSKTEKSSCQSNQNANRQIDKPSTSRETMIDRGNPRCGLKVSNKKPATLPNLYSALASDETHITSEAKIRSWLHQFPDNLNTDKSDIDDSIAENKKSPIEAQSIISISDKNSKSDKIVEVHRNSRINAKRRSSRDRKQSTDCSERIDEDNTLSQVNKEANQIDKIIEPNFTSSKLKYKTIHAKIRAKENREKNAKSSIEETNNQNSSTSWMTAYDPNATSMPSCMRSTSAISEQSTANWLSMIEFEKEMKRGSKRKVKKLNVSIEKNKTLPQIIEDVILSESNKYDSARLAASHKKSEKETNVSPESSDRKQNAIDKNLNLSDAKVKALIDTNNQTELFDKDGANCSKSMYPINTSATLEEGRQTDIINLNINQINKIIGLHNAAEDRDCEKNSADYSDASPSQRKRLTVVTPEKLNESVYEHERIRNILQTSTDNFETLSECSPEKRSLGSQETSNVQRTLDETVSSQLSSTSKKGRLSLKKRRTDNKNVESPFLSDYPLSFRFSMDINCSSDRKNVNSPVSKDDKLFDRLKVVRRDLNFKIREIQQRTDQDTISTSASKDIIEIENNNENVSKILQDKKLTHNFTDKYMVSKKYLSTKSKNVENQECRSLVKFIQLGSLNIRRLNRYFYAGPTKREMSMPAEVRVTSVCNMQLSRSEMYVATSPNLWNDSQNLNNITVVKNTCFANNLNSNEAVSKDFAALQICTGSATSTPKKNTDSHLNQTKYTKVVHSSLNANQRSDKSIENVTEKNAIHGISYIHPGTSKSIKLLSPDKDSQLKFLTIDSPTSEHDKLRRANSIKSVIKGNNFSETKNSLETSTLGKAQEPFIENPCKKRKRTRYANDRELFEDSDGNDSSNSATDSSRSTIKLDRYSELCREASSNRLDEHKKRRLSSSDDQDVEMISTVSKQQNAPRRKVKISSSESESESETLVTKNLKSDNQCAQWNSSITDSATKQCSAKQDSENLRMRNIIDKWSNEHTMQTKLMKESKNSQNSLKSTKSRSEEIPASHQSSHSSNALNMEKNSKPSQKSFARESDMFESSSFFNSDNVECILQSTKNTNDIPKKIANSSNDDIINKVLQIDRSRSNTDGRPDSVSRNDITSQREKDNRELLQDNFDEIIANVEQPQSEDFIPCSEQPDRNPNHPLAKQKTSNCLAMIDESCGIQEIPTISPSSTNDMFEQNSSRNVKKLPATNAISKFQETFNEWITKYPDKENVACNQKRYGYVGDQRDRNVSMTNANAFDKDSRKTVISKHNVSREKEKFPEERNVSIQSASRLDINNDKIYRATVTDNESISKDDTFDDSLMNITQHQVRLQMFERDLFGIASQNQIKTTKMNSQNDPSQREQRTPKKRKQNIQDKNTEPEECFVDEDDVVENTPEKKMKNGNSTIESEESAKPSFLTPLLKKVEWTPNTSKPHQIVHPLSNSSTPINLFEPSSQTIFEMDKRNERVRNDGILLAKQMNTNMLENVRWQPDKRDLRFVCSGLSAKEITTVKEFAAKHNASYVNQFDHNVTHVIVKTIGEQNVANSTLKYLQGIAHRKWLVSYRWIEDCNMQQKLLDEIPYEATTQTDIVTNGAGPRNSRLRDKDLFEGFTFLCIEPYDNVSLSQYEDLLRATGATVVNSFEALDKMGGLKGVVIQDNIHDDKTIEHWYRTSKAAPILVDWIVECIGHYTLLKLMPYSPCLSPQDFCAIGYPRELIEEDEEYSDNE
ncbi:PREDICTED: serine-rich adhesin for platelets-like isoform X2 [Trachymyrmex septentrionalis]|uniref:serine-rich adhesin for platelets-like isoform X2 n=1 Tax=Trachymyrmex septentrionalis TaxID=34720 RepID=UPI00084EE31C|nr:PREDICTED: serine-rich adhesin for platelets-like isoform X2 [Trachymyrmex septentrionalis]